MALRKNGICPAHLGEGPEKDISAMFDHIKSKRKASRTIKTTREKGDGKGFFDGTDREESSTRDKRKPSENTYTPNPIDTTKVELSSDILQLVEKLAENTHDVWAKQRIAQGWTYGEKRDDALKTTPCLVPYSELSESEKEYDRQTALETLRVILSLGYTIDK